MTEKHGQFRIEIANDATASGTKNEDGGSSHTMKTQDGHTKSVTRRCCTFAKVLRYMKVPANLRLYQNERVQRSSESEDEYQDVTVMLLQPFTGRRHQLRMHMLFLGHPMVGDPTYQQSEARSELRTVLTAPLSINPKKYKEASTASLSTQGMNDIAQTMVAKVTTATAADIATNSIAAATSINAFSSSLSSAATIPTSDTTKLHVSNPPTMAPIADRLLLHARRLILPLHKTLPDSYNVAVDVEATPPSDFLLKHMDLNFGVHAKSL